MHKINHPNILHLHSVMESDNNYYMVVDYCNKGDFTNFLHDMKVNFLEEKEAVFFLKQIMNGFRELRKHRIIHRDFKLSNLLVNNDILKIGDFGLAKRGQDIAKSVVGSWLTSAPEVLSCVGSDSNYNAKSDLWSVGFVYY